MVKWSGFSQTHKIGYIGINANFVVPCTVSFCYFQSMILVNIKLDIMGWIKITFQGHRLHFSNSLLMAELKWSWQYWYSCIVTCLWKTLVQSDWSRIPCMWEPGFIGGHGHQPYTFSKFSSVIDLFEFQDKFLTWVSTKATADLHVDSGRPSYFFVHLHMSGHCRHLNRRWFIGRPPLT